MNHCLLEVEVTKAPTIRYTQDNKTPIAEMEVCFQGLRPDDGPSELKIVGWGNMAQEVQNQAKPGQKLVVEGRLRMNTVPRQDGTKEKRAELTLSKMSIISNQNAQANNKEPLPSNSSPKPSSNPQPVASDEGVDWNSSPLIPDTDDIPF